MTYHLPEWIWYLAQLVVESRVNGVPEPIILIESILFRAESPEGAFKKADTWCASSDHVYRNRLGETVTQRYLGIHNIDDLQTAQLEDEQILQVRVVSNSCQCAASDLVKSKSQLSLFGGQRAEFSRLNQ